MTERRVQVAIVGAGPAGLSAAVSLRRAGIEVLLLEREGEAGGVPRHCGHPPFGWREFRRVVAGPAYAKRLTTTAGAAGAEIATRHSVTALGPDGLLSVATPDGLLQIRAERILLATGVRETTRAQHLIGGERPLGVMTTGALQSFVYGEGRLPFRRPLVVGSELVGLSALLTLRRAGARPVALLETRPRPVARWPLRLYPRLTGVPLLCGAALLEIRGAPRVQSVLLREAGGGERELACDGVVFSGGFRPAAELLLAAGLAVDPASRGPVVDQFGRCADPRIFAAGNLLRAVETAGWCWEEGRRVGRAIARDLTQGLPAGPAVQVETAGQLAYVVPQRLVPGDAPAALNRLQLRARADVDGTFAASLDAVSLWRRRQALRVERRLLLPLPTLPPGSRTFTVRLGD